MNFYNYLANLISSKMNRVLDILLEIGVIVKDLFVEVGVHPLSPKREEAIMKNLRKVRSEVRRIYSFVMSKET